MPYVESGHNGRYVCMEVVVGRDRRIPWTCGTDERESAAAWARAADQMADALELARIGSFEWRSAGDCLTVSDEVVRMLGMRPNGVPQTITGWRARVHPDDLTTVERAVADTLLDARPQRIEFRLRARHRSFRWAEGRVVAEHGGAGVVRVWGTVQDINERMQGRVHGASTEPERAEVSRLRAAIAAGRLALAGQEIVALDGGATVMHELLVRMIDERGKVVLPGEFLELAERHGIVKDIDGWVLSAAVELAATGRAVAVNLSAQTMGDPRYAERVLGSIARRDLDPAWLTFEITETALIENFRQAQLFARRLERLGCRLALDDFGTGYGALTYLKRFPVHYLKIDREFVSDLLTNPRSEAVIRGVVGLARSFGQRTVAEGVESAAVLGALRELGVDLVQGYLIGRPRRITAADRVAASSA